MRRKIRRSAARKKVPPFKTSAHLMTVAAELRAAAKEHREPDPISAPSPALADHLKWINEQRKPGGELYGTRLEGIANAFEALARGHKLTAEEIGGMMYADSN